MTDSIANSSITVTLNGETRAVPAGLTVVGLLEAIGIPADRVAVELNRAIVRKPEWATTIIAPGAQLEVVQFVGGG